MSNKQNDSIFEAVWESHFDPKRHWARMEEEDQALRDKLAGIPTYEEMVQLDPQAYDAEPVHVTEDDDE